MGSFFNSGSGPSKVDTDEDKENGWIESWVKKHPQKPSFWSHRRHGCSSGWCMCGCGPHFSNQLCIACSSGSVRWQSEQWWDDFSERYTGFVERRHATERNATRERGQKKARKPCLESFRHRSQMLFLLYFSILCRENTLWSRQFEKLGAAPNVGLLRECMCSGRMSELGHFAIENRHNGFLLLGWNRAGCSVIFLTSAKLKVLISHSDEAYLSFCYSLFAFYICGRFLFISGWCCQLCRLQHRRKGSFI